MVDSNEFHHANTWTFSGFTVSVANLIPHGCDYTVRGFVGKIGIERKSYADYVRCVGSGFKKFQDQLRRLRRNQYHCVIVEGSLNDPISRHSLVVPEHVLLRTAQITAAKIPVLFASNRSYATLLCTNFMKVAVRRIQDGV